MRLIQTASIASAALRKNIVRAFLTILGIVIGIAAVIAMVEIGQGSSAAIQKTIASMGANNLLVIPGTASSAGVSFGGGSNTTLTPDDATAIQQQIAGIKAVAPIVRLRTQIVYGNKNWVPQTLQGTTPEFLVVRDWQNLSAGQMFEPRDVRGANRVAVIGQTIAREFFPNESPIGKEIRIQNVVFRIIGVLSSKGANMMGSDQDDIVLAPWTTIKFRVSGTSSNQSTTSSSPDTNTESDSLYPSTGAKFYPDISASQSENTPVLKRITFVDQIILSTYATNQIPNAISEITQLLRQRHKLRNNEPDDFSIRDMTEMSKAMSSTSALMTRLLLFVALVSLLVGGVGIMNIMLVSVTERTKEIGLRMAVGAKPKDILLQFLVEALVLCLIGGAVGIALGKSCSYLLSSVLSWPTQTSIPAIISAVGVSASVGMIFGFYPAWKASKMDPIEALRYE